VAGPFFATVGGYITLYTIKNQYLSMINAPIVFQEDPVLEMLDLIKDTDL
jgi:hypothetical protein